MKSVYRAVAVFPKHAREVCGRSCPFDAAPAAEGRYVVIAVDARGAATMAKFEPAAVNADRMVRYDSHFATCPNAAAHSRRANRAKGNA